MQTSRPADTLQASSAGMQMIMAHTAANVCGQLSMENVATESENMAW